MKSDIYIQFTYYIIVHVHIHTLIHFVDTYIYKYIHVLSRLVHSIYLYLMFICVVYNNCIKK